MSRAVQRAISNLEKHRYDIAVIGGGIYGAYVAWDAALRGLRVALVDQSDFGHATSGNSQRIIHGGFRYLQNGDLRRMRESIRERTILLRTAPHLVYPMPVLAPTYGNGIHSRTVMGVALALNEVISADRNQGLPPEKAIARGRIISRDECLRLCPLLEHLPLTGGALFYDAQVRNSERHIISILRAAAQAGAHLSNYLQVVELTHRDNAVTGFRALDRLNNVEVAVQAGVVINCAGPWLDKVLNLVRSRSLSKARRFFKAILLVTRPLSEKIAVGVPSSSRSAQHALANKKGRLFFITPWGRQSLVGTFYANHQGEPDTCAVTPQDIQAALQEINAALPGAQLTQEDLYGAYVGLLPRSDCSDAIEEVQYAKQYKIYDHAQGDGITGLISVLGVKYTTARDVAEKAVDLACRHLRHPFRGCQTHLTPVYGGSIDSLNDFIAGEQRRNIEKVDNVTLNHLIRNYGTAYSEVLRYAGTNPRLLRPISEDSPVIGAEVIHSMQVEMAQTLSDVALRRTELMRNNRPDERILESCARLMAGQRGWSTLQVRQAVDQTLLELNKRGVYVRQSCQNETNINDRPDAIFCR